MTVYTISAWTLGERNVITVTLGAFLTKSLHSHVETGLKTPLPESSDRSGTVVNIGPGGSARGNFVCDGAVGERGRHQKTPKMIAISLRPANELKDLRSASHVVF